MASSPIMQSLVRYLLEQIPLLRPMGISAGELTVEWLELSAPLDLNLNDKQTAFGGSLASLCTLSGWCVVSSVCQHARLEVDIAVTESQIRYLKPVVSDPIIARAYFPPDAEVKQFLERLKAKGKASLAVEVKIWLENSEAVLFHSQYYARIMAN